MTVKELINYLENFDKNMNVVVECDDCEGKWYEIDEDSEDYDSDSDDNTLVLHACY